MAASIGTLSAKITADANGLFLELDRAEKRMKKFGSEVAGLTSLFSKTLSGLGVGLGIGTLTSAVKETIDDAGRLSDAAAKLEIGATALAKLELAAKLGGVEAGTLHDAISKLQAKLGEAAVGSAEARADFDQLGLSWEKLIAQDPADTFTEVALKVGSLGDAFSRAAGAQAAFGRGGRDMLPFLRNFSESMRQATDALGDLTDETIEKLDKMGDRFDTMWARIKARTADLTVKGAEKLDTAVDAASKPFEQFGLLAGRNEPAAASAATSAATSAAGGPTALEAALEAGRRAAAEETAKEMLKFQDEIDKANEAMEAQAAAFGKSAAHAQVYKLSLEAARMGVGFFAENMMRAADQLERMDKLVKGPTSALGIAGQFKERLAGAQSAFGGGLITREQMAAVGGALEKELTEAADAFRARMFEAVATPLESFRAKVVDINAFLQGQTRQRALGQLIEEAERKLKTGRNNADVGAARFGSVEAGSTLNRALNDFLGRRSPQERVEAVQKQLLEESKRQTKLWEKLAESWGVADVGQ